MSTSAHKLSKKFMNGELDINVQELFMSKVIKGLLYNLNDDIKIRGELVPHYIMHTGDDRMFLFERGYDNAIEPIENSNEKHTIYDIIPKCIVRPTNIDLDISQLTSPYSMGSIQYTDDEGVYMFKGEFRRMPVKLGVELKYYVDSYTDMLELIQYIISNLSFIRTYSFMYMGQSIRCSYKIPEAFGEEHTLEIDGAYQDSREHTLSMTLEIESTMPVFNNKTLMAADGVIVTPVSNIITHI